MVIQFPISNLKKTVHNLTQSGRKTVLKFERLETQLRTKLLLKLTWSKKISFKHIFGIRIKFPIQQPEKTLQNLVHSGRKAVLKFELPETQFETTPNETHLEEENDCFEQIFRIFTKSPTQYLFIKYKKKTTK